MRVFSRILFSFLAYFCLMFSGAADNGSLSDRLAYRLDEVAPNARASYYSTRILKVLDHWPPPTASLQDARPVVIRAIKTPGHPEIVGIIKHFEVMFPIEKVVELTEKFEDYPRVWKDVLSVQVTRRDHNRVETEWVRRAPAFFLSKIRFRLLYTWDKTQQGRVIYREQLIDGNSVHATDALVVLEKHGTDSTRISVLDFFDPDAGPFRGLVEGKIWKASVENSFKDDIAFRARLEHPDWSVGQISDEADRMLDRYPVGDIEYTDLIRP
jgi:uncharacterized membrane protein